MIQAYKNFFKGYADFTGRSTRSEYWWIWLGNMILLVPFYSAYFKALANPRNETALMALGGIAIIYMILGIVFFTPSLAVKVRRLRDAGLHWALIFLYFVPMGGIALLVLLAIPSKEVEIVTINRPKEVESEEVSPFE